MTCEIRPRQFGAAYTLQHSCFSLCQTAEAQSAERAKAIFPCPAGLWLQHLSRARDGAAVDEHHQNIAVMTSPLSNPALFLCTKFYESPDGQTAFPVLLLLL